MSWLSQKTWHKCVPRERQANLHFRKKLLAASLRSPAEQTALIQACTEDILFYINVFGWTYDPEVGGGIIPFLTWPAQDHGLYTILEAIEKRRDLVIEKSRRQGGSWLSIVAMEYIWHFHPWKQFLMISRDANMVDGPTPDSLFWKLDFFHKYQPDWLLPKMNRLRMYFENEDNGSTITGQATSAKAGVGGRATAMFVDEFARIDEDREVLDSTADTTKCRIFNSTHAGTGTAFFDLTERKDVMRLRLHWSENPSCNQGLYRYDAEAGKVEVLDKSYEFPDDFKFVQSPAPLGGPYPGVRSPWYDAECDRRGNSRAIAMDLDIDPRGSTHQFFDAAVIRSLIRDYALPPVWQGDIRYDLQTGKPLDLVAIPTGPLKIWCNLHDDKPPRGRYGAGADISQGTGATPSCLSIANCRTGEKVAEYAHAFLDPKTFAMVSVALCRWFADEDGEPARLCWEQQGPGISYGGRVMECGFMNFYTRTQEVPFSTRFRPSDTPGWVPNDDTTLVMLEDYRQALSARHFINRSEIALKETLDFRYNSKGKVEHANYESKGDPTGARQNHGDRVIADGLCYKMCKGASGLAPLQKPDGPPVGSFAWRRKMREDAEREQEAWA